MGNNAIILIVILSNFLKTVRVEITLMSDNLEEKYLKALQLEKQVFGVPHSIVANTLNRLGAIYDQQQNYELAEQHYRQSLEMSTQLFGEEDPNTTIIQCNYQSFLNERQQNNQG